MIFSKEFKIELQPSDEWFDPILSMDTKLFIDPFLIFDSNHPQFENSYKKTMAFFNIAFEIASKSSPNINDLRYRQLLRMMNFPEVEEICLGYASRGTSGSGSGGGFSKIIVNSIYNSIKLGITNFDRFEEIGLFHEGFGCDRISDMTATLIKEELISYTKLIAKKHQIATKDVSVSQAKFDSKSNRWISQRISLPLNPYTKKPILLVPKIFLRELPTLSSEEFFDYCWTNLNEEIRDQYSLEVKSGIKKSQIIEIARQNPRWIQEFKTNKDIVGSKPYDLVNDPKGYYKWVTETEKYVSTYSYQFTIPKTNNEFNQFVDEVLNQFEHFIENNSGYKLLWDDHGKKAKSEEASQLIFTGIVKHYCRANNIDLCRETNLGRGPVDFKFSSGYQNRALIEVKLARNSSFWNGLEKQLIKYLEVEEIKKGYFLVICYNDKDLTKIKDIQTISKKIEDLKKVSLSIIVIDASMDKPSASKLK